MLNKCPNCSKRGILIIDKLLVGPKSSTKCKFYKNKIFLSTIEYIIACVPVLLGFFVSTLFFNKDPLVWIGGILLAFVSIILFVPLVVKDEEKKL